MFADLSKQADLLVALTKISKTRTYLIIRNETAGFRDCGPLN